MSEPKSDPQAGGDDRSSLPAGLRSGDGNAIDRQFAEVYDNLRAIAANYLKGERREHTLQPTALVHEAYLKLAAASGTGTPLSRAHFLRLAARAMRRALVDHARHRDRVKRGGGECLRVTLDPAVEPVAGGETLAIDILALDAALAKLDRLDPRQAQVVELRVFSGMTLAETAAALGVATSTVHGDWEMARAWLWRELNRR